MTSMRSATVKPGVSASTMKAENPFAPGRFTGAREHHVVVRDAAIGDPGLRAVDAHMARCRPGVAVVAIAATSEPPSGSESAKAAIALPSRTGGK